MTGQDWLQLEFPLGEHDAERVGALLESLDALAVTLADAIGALGNRVQALGAQAERDPKAFVTAMFTPSSPVAAELRKSPFMQLLVAIGRFVHAEEIEKAPDDILALATWLQQLVQERIGSVVIAFAAAGEAATLTRRLVRAAGLLDASIATGTLATRREAARAAFAQATTTLTGTVDEAAARAELASANSALAAYVAEVSSILAFGVASASIIGVPGNRRQVESRVSLNAPLGRSLVLLIAALLRADGSEDLRNQIGTRSVPGIPFLPLLGCAIGPPK